MLPRLGTNHLALIAMLSETRAVGDAARRLGLTQSAASHRLREAERRVGAPLVRRHARGIELTEAGERVAQFAERFLAELLEIEQDIESARGGRVVRWGQATYSRYHWLPSFFAFLAEIEPTLTPNLSGGATTRPLASLIDGTVDVSTVYARPSESKRFDWYPLGEDPFVAVMLPGHRLAEREYVTAEDFGREKLFLYPFASEPGFEWETLLGRPTAPFRNATTMPTPEAAIDLVRAGLGMSLISRWAVGPELAAGTLIQKPIGVEGTTLDWWAVTRAGEAEGSPAMRLVRALMSWEARDNEGKEDIGEGA